ncbi:iron reductase [Multifurca ochricompacta]|uniref:ferric-chelate reductase (NADPH) n=1 Tax=Multifurca ochricompacta TaxID=376703 RepID=A0AAD4M062_9AGAM|nr:iron reductase [Multifurca ochricompacta]
MSDFGPPPVIPPQFQIYNSYVEDPKWQRLFTEIWAGCLGLAIVLSLPALYRALRKGRMFTGLFGVWEDIRGQGYVPARVISTKEGVPTQERSRVLDYLTIFRSILLWSPLGFELNLGQVIVVVLYFTVVIICIVTHAPLMDNPNRAGFLALAQLPIVFLFATKNSLLSLLLGPGNGYEKLNYIHRWSGRGLFLGAVIHGSLWIRNHIQYHLPVLGPQKETSGVAALSLLCIIVLSSVRPVRIYLRQIFFYLHVLTYVSFFVTICYHTIYARPWIYPPLAFYGLDLLMRLFRFRIKDAELTPLKNMTIIHVDDCDGGWEAGQHVQLRIFFGGRVFESHPLTIANAPASISCLSSRSIVLGARVTGDWTRALNRYASAEQERIARENSEKVDAVRVPVHVTIDGPYGGCSLDLGEYENVFLVAGGAGVTFTLGLLDDLVGRVVRHQRARGERTRRVEFAWAIRSFGNIDWFAPMLMDIANTAAESSLDLHISIFVTCLCDPEAVPPLPNSIVTIIRPNVEQLLSQVLRVKMMWRMGTGRGGVGVCASGPESLTRETANAVAILAPVHARRVGGIALHTEVFSL